MGVRFTLWAVDAERLLDVLTADEVSAAQENSLLLQSALRRVSKSSQTSKVVQLLLDGHRRWWVGSFLDSLRRFSPWLLNRNDVEHVENLFSLMLGGWDCGTTVSASPLISRSSFPITPTSDADLRFAVLSPSDFEFLRLFLSERLRDEDRRFVHPSGTIGIAPDDDEEWDAWAREVIQKIATTPLNVLSPSLVSFLG